ncbi:hypothetical protein [Burkholderia latens]|uniref:hypothetical protein n=1 Tax=Burkholderia latens TaxID=488446 RepID=UPI0039A44AA1
MKGFEYEIVTPDRLIKFDKLPDFKGNRVPRRCRAPSATLSGPSGIARAGHRHAATCFFPHPVTSNHFIARQASVRPRPPSPRGGAPGQHGFPPPPVSIIVLVRNIRPGFVNP